MLLINKIILTNSDKQTKLIKEKFNLKNIENEKNIEIFEWIKNIDWEEQKIILINIKQNNNINEIIEYIIDNYDIFKIIIIWLSKNITWIDYKDWDIIIPNTFFELKNNKISNPIFLEYAISQNYDLNKFGLILNWICITTDKNIEDKYELQKIHMDYNWDIIDNNSFELLSIIKDKDLIDKCVVIKAINNWYNEDNLNNSLQNSLEILELIL